MIIDDYDIWEELVFGNTDWYGSVLDGFADRAEHMATQTNVDAKDVVRVMLRRRGIELHRRYSNADIYPDYFHSWFTNKLATALDTPHEDIVEHVVEWLPSDLDEPNELPVNWPED